MQLENMPIHTVVVDNEAGEPIQIRIRIVRVSARSKCPECAERFYAYYRCAAVNRSQNDRARPKQAVSVQIVRLCSAVSRSWKVYSGYARLFWVRSARSNFGPFLVTPRITESI